MREIAFGIIIALLFISLVVLFCVLLVKLYIKKIKEHNLKEIEFQKALTTTVVETQEQVLQNISQDLHDDAGQQLTAINFQLENLKLDFPDNIQNIEPISKSLVNLSNSIRAISHSLNNQLVLQQDLKKVIQTEVERLQKNTKIRFNLKVELAETILQNDEKIIIYRIFQEAINNCLKHAKATQISIEITSKPYFNMTIVDNGKGFNTSKKLENSFGLISMKHRAALINYNLTISSEEVKGTTLQLTSQKG